MPVSVLPEGATGKLLIGGEARSSQSELPTEGLGETKPELVGRIVGIGQLANVKVPQVKRRIVCQRVVGLRRGVTAALGLGHL
jgi:hypothetical protein